MIVGVGTDIVDIRRIKEKIQKESFLNGVYAEEEIENIKKRGNRAESYAGVFAAKEAVAKSLGTGYRQSLDIKEVCILNDYLGKPYVEFKGQSAEKAKNIFFHLSISHSDDYATAFVVAENI